MTYRTSAGSGVPKVGAPDCIEIELANDPSTTGAPGRTSCTNGIPASASARGWAQTPAAVTGDIAPARRDGRINVGRLFPGSTRAARSILGSQSSAEFA